MYRKIVWCYVFVLTLLDITLNTKLSAQGKSHGVTVHDSLIEGITFQEWGGPGAVAAGALQLSPPALHFGRAALAAAHALTVTLTNTANTTMHLASVAGTTPDFHASFFDSKTLPPQANTSFTVVYLGRREGPVSAHIYIHTSLGVHKYPVSAEGVASQWGVWPLLGVRVPLNASVEPLLTLHNPTDHTIQVSEVYSSGAWLGLELPGGGARAPRELWAVPARSSRPLVRLRLAPGAAAAPLTAYVRIKGNMTGGGLLVCVTARSVPPGEHLSPLQLRLRTRGSLDPPDVSRACPCCAFHVVVSTKEQPHRPSVLQATCLAHYHFSFAILRAKSDFGSSADLLISISQRNSWHSLSLLFFFETETLSFLSKLIVYRRLLLVHLGENDIVRYDCETP
ncbi:hypothetical protein B5X24_HaOG216852 [Helicoverpa armigera]|nr:hypothetical protein B5X24_HaOG216852 [Helicoverpa armigera]